MFMEHVDTYKRLKEIKIVNVMEEIKLGKKYYMLDALGNVRFFIATSLEDLCNIQWLFLNDYIFTSYENACTYRDLLKMKIMFIHKAGDYVLYPRKDCENSLCMKKVIEFEDMAQGNMIRFATLDEAIIFITCVGSKNIRKFLF